jgi:ribose transport system substrate-binding protein
MHHNRKGGGLRYSRALIPALGAVVLLAIAVGVGVSSGARAATPTVAFISQGTSNSWAAQLDAAAKEEAAKDGLKEIYFNGQGSGTTQLPLIAQAAAQHPSAIVLVPLAAAADTGPVARAMASGIPVILCDSAINGTNYTSVVNPNATTGATGLAEWLAKKMHYKGNLLYIGGLPGNGTTIAYDKGFYPIMKKYPNIKIVNGGNANYSISTAKQLAATAIASGKTFAGTWGVGGEAVTGILQAYADSNVRPIPPNAGAAATNGALRLAVQEKVDAAMLQFPPTDAKLCIDTAAKAIKGQKVPKSINVSALAQFGDIYPPLNKWYKPAYSDDLYVGSDTGLTQADLAALHLKK